MPLTIEDYQDALADKRRLTRDLDVAMHGEAGAAKQASLCDLIGSAQQMREDTQTLRAVLDECAQWMTFREKMIPGIERLCDRARRILAETQRRGG